jgi:hypothetical protein
MVGGSSLMRIEIIEIGDALGRTQPDEVLARLGAKVGDEMFLVEGAGCLYLERKGAEGVHEAREGVSGSGPTADSLRE